MNKYDIAAYVWPAYTGREARTRIFWQEGCGEWQSVKSAKAKFPGHSQPRKPLWGYVDEADPSVMEMEIEAASSHGVNVFIYDWYWYDDRPFLENCLADGFLKASNRNKMKFYLMWANHDANHLWCKDLADSQYGNTVIWKGGVSRPVFEKICRRIIEKYFSEDNYYKINGAPVFMIYELSSLAEGLGGTEQTADALRWFRRQTELAGFPGLHLQFTARGGNAFNLSGIDGGKKLSAPEIFRQMCADSFTHYQFVHFTNVNRDYIDILQDVEKEWALIDKTFSTPYFPHISCGWDNNPRFNKLRENTVKNNTPENFEKALRAARFYIDSHNLPAPLITVNSWNEWTETSYLEPDDLYGYGYLDAIKKVFLN